MSEEQKKEASWDEATESVFLTFKDNVRTTLKIIDWSLYETTNKFKKKPTDPETMINFNCKVLEIDGKPAMEDKVWDTASKPLLRKLRPVLEGKNPDSCVVVSVKVIEENGKKTYDIEEVTGN